MMVRAFAARAQSPTLSHRCDMPPLPHLAQAMPLSATAKQNTPRNYKAFLTRTTPDMEEVSLARFVRSEAVLPRATIHTRCIRYGIMPSEQRSAGLSTTLWRCCGDYKI